MAINFHLNCLCLASALKKNMRICSGLPHATAIVIFCSIADILNAFFPQYMVARKSKRFIYIFHTIRI